MSHPRYAMPSAFLPMRARHLDGKKAAGVKDVMRAGEIAITSGRLVACDPMVQPERPPFERVIPPGRYAVNLFVAKEGSAIGFAEIRLRSTALDRFEIATLAGQDAATLGEGQIFGYPVDSGLGCFADEAALRRLQDADARRRTEGSLQGIYYDAVVREELAANGGSWADHRPDRGAEENVVIFRSGDGDGTYATYFGLDAEGQVACVVTSFHVFKERESPDLKLRKVTEMFAPFVAAVDRDIGAVLRSKGFSGPEVVYTPKSSGGELDLRYTRDELSFQVSGSAMAMSLSSAHYRWRRGRSTLDVGNEHRKAGVPLDMPNAFGIGDAAYMYAGRIGASYAEYWEALEKAVLVYLPVKAAKKK